MRPRISQLLATSLVWLLAAGCNCGPKPPIGPEVDGGEDAGDTGGDAGEPDGGDGGSGPCTGPASCYFGPANTAGSGACRAGTAQCIAGSLGPCVGEVLPSAEACNGIDDDCNGTADDATALGNVACGLGACRVTVAACTNGRATVCAPGTPQAEVCNDGIDNNCDGAVDEGCACVHVAPAGQDTNSGTAQQPLRSLNAGIAVALDGGFSSICVASGNNCPSSTTYAAAVSMRDGLSLYGGYASSGPTWPRQANCTTRIQAQDDRGVFFDQNVTSPTTIDGFTILGGSGQVNAAVTVEGSTGAIINSNVITGGSGVTSYGINVMDSGGKAATPVISRNAITGGSGSAAAIGVRSLRSKPTVTSNCSSFGPLGRCNSFGCWNATRFIRGRAQGSTGQQSIGIRLEDSPGALVEASGICSSGSTGESAGVRLSGDAQGTVIRTSQIDGNGGAVSSVGVWVEPCAGASPWVFDNLLVAATSPVLNARADGIRAVGDCHPRIDSNVRIVGGEESSNNDANGVYCARDSASGVASRCTILGNLDIEGSFVGVPPTATGVRCDRGACARLERNRISARGGVRTAGVILDGAGTVVSKNLIRAGCAATEGVGLLSLDSYARVENNEILGAGCSGTATPSSYAVRVVLGQGNNELDLHSNDLGALGAPLNCTSRALGFDVPDGGAPAAPRGIVRNNILHAGFCATRVAIDELGASADPRVLENNDLWVTDGGSLYRDEGSSALTAISQVNGLGDLTASGNISADPVFDGGLHLAASSPCRNAGTAAGAPTEDAEGDSRPQESAPDIGLDEFKP